MYVANTERFRVSRAQHMNYRRFGPNEEKIEVYIGTNMNTDAIMFVTDARQHFVLHHNTLLNCISTSHSTMQCMSLTEYKAPQEMMLLALRIVNLKWGFLALPDVNL